MEKRLMTLLAGTFLFAGSVMAQTNVSGTVTSGDDGEPVVGAAIKVEGTNTGTVTDVNGHFQLNAPAGAKLVVTYIGMKPQTVKAGGNMKVVLQNDNHTLDDVVVVAYGTAKRQSITGAVTAIDAKDIEKHVTTNALEALEGSAPGIQVNSTYGEPGSEPQIRIRGIGTINGSNDPLYVVDGTIYNGNISDLNPNDIASMSVLKDAASAALYGNRAAAGVVIITTKSGRGAGKSNVNLTVNQGWYRRGIPEYERLSAKPWMESYWKAMYNWAQSGSLHKSPEEAAAYANTHIIDKAVKRNIFDAVDDKLFDANGNLTADVLPGYDDLDWEDDIERTGSRQDYTLSGSYNSTNANVYSSVGYTKENGYVIGSDYKRYTARVNADFKPSKYLTTGVNLMGATSKRHFNDNAYGSYFANPFYVARMMAPVYPLFMHNADGSYELDANGDKQYDTTSDYLSNRNIAYELRADQDESRRNVINGTAYATVNLPYDFSVTVRSNMSQRTNNRTNYNNPNIGDGATNNGRLTEYAYEYNDYTMQEFLNWTHEYGKHHVDAMLGHENNQNKARVKAGMNTNMVSEGIIVLSNFITNSYLNGYNTDYKTESYLARARYNYDERYFFDASWRRDGSSRFHPDNRWGNFFSFGGNWNVKKEAFMKDVSWVNSLRLRASYGEVGNDAGVGLYGYQALYYIGKNGGNGALMKQSLAANDIKWETAQTIDVALEGRLFDRVNFSLGYYNRRNKDLLFEVKLPLSGGSFSYNEDDYNMSIYRNIGTIRNQGFEFAADVDILKGHGLLWNFGLDATFNANKIIKLPNNDNIISGLQNYTEGRSLYDFYTYHFEGVDQLTGQSLYTIDPDKKNLAKANHKLVTINGVDYTTDPSTAGLRGFHGHADPTVYGSFHTNLAWKGLSLSMLFTYSLGGKIYDGTYQSLMSTSSMDSGSALSKDALKSWTAAPAGMTETSANRIDPNGIPVLDFNRSSYNNYTSDRWLTSASYLIFKNLTLSYNLPKQWMTVLGGAVSGVSVKFSAENLFTVSARKGLNPQYLFTAVGGSSENIGSTQSTYVTSRVFNLGLSIDF
ncbi:SusC/RagA family TonB-linked outer membrane protein [Hallella absiana]|uniref:SusC/RagA family TonB-linked outer membrane protein n=1 Tax=Hallella absiana TaxID=2925336 RepID=UPI0021C88F56|nr:TonB-dependent receptor [Hallella absiana]